MAELMHGTVFASVDGGPFLRLGTAVLDEVDRFPDDGAPLPSLARSRTGPDPFAYIPLRTRRLIGFGPFLPPLARAAAATEVFGRAWLRAHPSRRLPGGMRNRRLAKKRAQYLERWAREVGLA